MEVTTNMKEYVETKLKKLHKFENDIKDIHVIFSVQKYMHKVEIEISFLHHDGILRDIVIHEETNDMYKSVDSVIDKLCNKCTHIKERIDEK